MFDYSGSTALVTGASKGLGAAFAEALAQRGMNLVLVARSTDELNVLSKRLDSKYKIQSTVLSIDLANPSSPHRIAEELERRGIQVDLLVNNAGFGLSGKFLSHDFKQKQAEVEVNIQALVALTHHFGKAMAARGKGGIINVASNASFQPVPKVEARASMRQRVLSDMCAHISARSLFCSSPKNVYIFRTNPEYHKALKHPPAQLLL